MCSELKRTKPFASWAEVSAARLRVSRLAAAPWRRGREGLHADFFYCYCC